MENMNKKWKTLLDIAIPISMQNLLMASLSAVDQIMIGKLGTIYVAGTGIGYKIPNLFVITITAVATSTSIIVSQYYGANNKRGMIKALKGNGIFALLLLCAFLFPSVLFSKSLINLFTQEKDVINIANSYFRIILISFLPIAVRALVSSYMRSIKKIKIVVVASIISVITNTILNYILIFGKMGFPKLTYVGAAVATVISIYVECIILIIAFRKEITEYGFNIFVENKVDKKFFKTIRLILVPLLVTEFLWGLGDTLYSLIYSRIGIKEMASMALTYPIQNACIGLFGGVSAAAAIVVGNFLGADKKEEAYDYSIWFIKLGIIGGIILGILLAAINKLYVNLYAVDLEVRNMTYTMIIVYAFIAWIKISNMIAGGGIIRSGGETKITLYMDLLGTWVLGIPLGFICAFLLDVDLPIVYLAISFEELVRFIISLVVVKRKKWMMNITKEEKEMESTY
ncbi:MAG: MATE family efflux transporter [Clostridium butyricum]|nr:MATE family efflux transporter [Clostridium butyricum]